MTIEVPHWSPESEDWQREQLATYDEARRRCPVVHSEQFAYSVLGHKEVTTVLADHHTYSNKAGSYLSIPNGMDPPQHTFFRRLIDRYFSCDAMAAFAPHCSDICRALIQSLPSSDAVDIMPEFAAPFAQRVQCAFMGWPDDLQEPLREWVKQNQKAIAAQDRPRLAGLAIAFDAYIRGELDKRRAPGYQPVAHDVTLGLMSERTTIDGQQRLLTDDELVSIIRNWTVGELGTISACVGIIFYYLGEHKALQNHLRQHPEQISDAVDEILRIHPPLITNRRKTAQATTLGGFPVPRNSRVTVFWAAANRDEKVFGEADRFDPQGNKANNLLYGAGIHQCPGAPLARLELNMLFAKLLETQRWCLAETPPVKAMYPAGGFHSVHVKFSMV